MAWLMVSILIVFSQTSLSKPSCSSKGQFIKAEKLPKSEYALLKKSIKEATAKKKLNMYGYENSLDFLFERADWLDINNDGMKEAILKIHEGSSSNISFFIFRKKGKAYHSIPTPHNLEVSKGITRKSSHGLYARVCGKTYVARGYLGDWESIVWNGSKVSLACNSEWLSFIRYLIPKIIKKGDYSLALETAQNTYKPCKNSMTDHERLWFLSDMSYIAYRLGDFSLCKNFYNEGRNHNSFNKANSRVKKALLANNNLCSREQLSLKKDGFLKVCQATQKSKHLVNQADQLIIRMIQESQYECNSETPKVCDWTKEISCEKRAQQIAKTKKLTIQSCRIADLENLDFLEGFKGLEELSLILYDHARCLYKGSCKIKDWTPIEKIKLKKLEVYGYISDDRNLIGFIKQQKSLKSFQFFSKLYNKKEMASLSHL